MPEQPDPADPRHVTAPFAGVVSLGVAVGDMVTAGQALARIEAVKMEAAIRAPRAGTVQWVTVAGPGPVEGGDVLVVIR